MLHPDMKKDRKDVVSVKFLLDGTKIPIAHAVTIN